MKISQKRLSTFVDILRALVPECRLMITETGINTLVVDTANVAMVRAVLPKASFEVFNEERAEIGMDVGKWKTLLGIMNDPDSAITITRKDNQLRISDGKWDDTHTPLDPNTVRKRPNEPGLNLPVSVVIDAKEYAESVRAMAVIGDKVRIRSRGDNLVLDVEGDSDQLQKTIEMKEAGKIVADPVSSLFSIEYLKDTARAMKGTGTITVHMAQDHPIRFDFDIDGIEAGFMIAPRLEAD
jgi:proliferating cell nuclear antigen